jgi:DNA-binding HxlR family transcriptional regulator
MLTELAAGGRRYQDIYTILDGVSHKVLTDTLRSAERDGLLTRRLDSERTDTPTLYELTNLGRSISEPLAMIERWVGTNWHLVEATQVGPIFDSIGLWFPTGYRQRTSALAPRRMRPWRAATSSARRCW